MSQEFKMLKRDELIDIFYQVFIEEYQVSSSYLKDDSSIATLESNYEGIYDRWIAAVFNGMGMEYLDYDNAESKFEHLDNQSITISQLITNTEENSQFKNSFREELITRIGDDASVDFFIKNLSYLVERINGWG